MKTGLTTSEVNSPIELSIIIPTRNRSHHLQRALEPFTPFSRSIEIIVVDDASDSFHRVRNTQLCQRFPNCRYEYLTVACGGSTARNCGLRLSLGGSIWFLDDDDYAPQATIRDVNMAIRRNSQNVYLIPRMIVHGATPIRIDCPVDEAVKWSRYRDWGVEVTTFCAVFPRSTLDRLGGWDESLPSLQDTDLFLRAARIANFGVIDTDPVRVDVGSPHRITNSFLRSQIGKWRFLRKHWQIMPWQRRLRYLVQILGCSPLWRAHRIRRQLASLPSRKVQTTVACS